MSIKEVAREAGVSVGTVSNVLNRPDIVAATTRQRVLDVIDQLGFVRNEAARHLRAGQSRTIGLQVLDVANPFFADVALGAQDAAEEHGAMIMLCSSGEDGERERRQLEQLERHRVMGILFTPVDSDAPQLERLRDRGIPVVLVDRGLDLGGCSVAVDNVLGGRLAVAHLIEQGHRRIAYVGGPESLPQVIDRYKGGAAAADASGASLVNVVTESMSLAEGRRAAEQVVRMPRSRRPTAAFCANDLLALGFLQEAIGQEFRVPEDIAIVGYDDIDFAAGAAVPLSSVRQPRHQLGRTGAEMLLDEVEQPEQHRHRQILFQPELVVRKSSSHRRRVRGSGTQPAAPARRAG